MGRVGTVSECCIIEQNREKKILFCLWMSAFELNLWISEIINAVVYSLCLLTVLWTYAECWMFRSSQFNLVSRRRSVAIPTLVPLCSLYPEYEAEWIHEICLPIMSEIKCTALGGNLILVFQFAANNDRHTKRTTENIYVYASNRCVLGCCGERADKLYRCF